MSRILAIVEEGVVRNVIRGLPADFPGSIDVTDLPQRPAPDWTYAAGVFTRPAFVERERFGVLKAEILREMTPVEYATWEGIAQAVRANPGGATGPQRVALKALAIFNAYPPLFDKRDASFGGLKTVWVNAGIVATEARADAIIAAALTD